MWYIPTAYERKDRTEEKADSVRLARISKLQESLRETRQLLKYVAMARMVPFEMDKQRYSLPMRRRFGDLNRGT